MAEKSSGAAGGGIWFILGFLCSYYVNHSIAWAIIHGFCGGIYFIYFVIKYVFPKL